MLAFTKETIPLINPSLDFYNVMTYDLMNRRDNITKHHTGIQISIDGVDAYLQNGVPATKISLGFAFYVKWFRTEHDNCADNPIGCLTVLMEDPQSGADLGQAGAFSWIDEVPSELATSFSKAQTDGRYDSEGGGYYYWDSKENIWWTWDTPEAILKKFPTIVDKLHLGGVFAWGLGEDSKDWSHLKALTKGFQESNSTGEKARKSSKSTSGFRQDSGIRKEL